MKRSLVTLCGSVLTLLVLAGASARANPVPPDSISVTENWAPTGSGFVVFPGGSRVYAIGADPIHNANDHYVNFSNESAVSIDVPTQFSSLPAADIVASNLTTASTATKTKPDVVDTNYTLSVVLTDNSNNATGTAIFHGHLHAIFYSNYSSMQNTFIGPTSESFNINGNTLTVTLDQFTHSTSPGSANHGSIGGEIVAKFQGGGQPPPPHDTPEPSTLVLSFLGLTGLGAASWRKWLARRAA